VRFRSVAILDEESLLAVCAYIDVNPVAAGIEAVPEAFGRLDGAVVPRMQGRNIMRAGGEF
jgi:hypothetical protein